MIRIIFTTSEMTPVMVQKLGKHDLATASDVYAVVWWWCDRRRGRGNISIGGGVVALFIRFSH